MENKMKRIYKSPESIDAINQNFQSIFLAGSIEMDKAINWQKKCEEILSNKYVIFNPRRNEWNADWEQSITNVKFKEQVDWELNALDKADIIIMFFANNTKSPISLLELGLFADSKKLKVVVEENFWRKGNVDIVCEKYSIPQYKNLEELLENLIK
jgi:hypothetical protein